MNRELLVMRSAEAVGFGLAFITMIGIPLTLLIAFVHFRSVTFPVVGWIVTAWLSTLLVTATRTMLARHRVRREFRALQLRLMQQP